MSKLAVFRADANPQIGTGHVFRCSVLGRELQKQGVDVTFVCRSLPEKIAQGPLLEPFDLYHLKSEELPNLNLAMQELGNSYDEKILIIDSDHVDLYDSVWQKTVKSSGWKLMYFTFYNEYKFLADIVLNQNIRAPELNYQCEEYTRLLLGTEYVILKDAYEGLSAAIPPENSRDRNQCLLFFGGADLRRATLQVLKALLKGPPLFEKLILVIGALNPDKTEIEALAKAHSESVDLYINTPKMPELMTQCGYAITTGGLTGWELATLKVFQMVIPSSERERVTAEYCSEKGWVHLWAGELNESSIYSWVKQCRNNETNLEAAEGFFNKVAVNGTKRVAEEIMNLLS